ncbi:MAG: ROK family protein [FCB group bacterium]|jgi:glucokinase|nr:ROK family protein [FCB group bacterium]
MGSGGIVAVDMGGTRMRCAAVGADDAMGPVRAVPTLRERPAQAILKDLAALIADARRELPQCDGLALGIPTVLDAEGGLVECDNLPTMTGVSIKAELHERTGMTVRVNNDASCFAMGEWWKGAGAGCRNLCGITLGTGIGLGLVLDGRLYSGSHGAAGEIWRTPLPDGRTVEECGSGSFLSQAFASRTALCLAGEEIARRAAQGDPDAHAAFDEYGRALGSVVAFVVNLVDPDVTVLGGSIARSFALFEQSLRTVLNNVRAPRVEASGLGESAALWGAAKLFRDGKG